MKKLKYYIKTFGRSNIIIYINKEGRVFFDFHDCILSRDRLIASSYKGIKN